MFERILREYGLDHVYVRSNWTVQQLKLYMDRLQEFVEMHNAQIRGTHQEPVGEDWQIQLERARARCNVTKVLVK